MKTKQDTKLETLEQELHEMKQMLEYKAERKSSKYVVQLKEVFSRTLINVIDDMPTTLIGVGTAGSILFAAWPNIDHATLVEAVGIGSLGGASNSKTKPKETLEENYLNNTEELG
jgi:hypothetical protein